ncbi:MAG: serine/threonine-protein kinase [Planctomycetota bacterium]
MPDPLGRDPDEHDGPGPSRQPVDDDATVISSPAELAASWSGSVAPRDGLARAPASTADIGRLLEGSTLGPYRLDRFIGGGGMGAVFRAIDTTLDRVVAVKVLAGRQADDEEMLKRFRNEAQSAARLDHENIGRVHAVGSDEGWHYIVFEFIEGTNIRDLVRQQGPFDVARTVDVAVQIADALEHAAERDVVHRDIKPSNVVITPAGRARIVDMGLARLHQVADDQDLTVSGMTLGTFDYISPEQARDPRAADVRSDLYSLGCTIFFMLVGRPPFADGTMVQKLLQHQQDRPPVLDEIRPDVPRRLAAIVERLMAKDPEDRYQRPAVLAADLAAVADEEGFVLADERPVSPPPSSMPSRLPWLLPLVGLMGLVMAAWLRSAADRGDGASLRRPLAEPVAVVRPATITLSAPATGRDAVESLAAAVSRVADGGTIELAYDGPRREPPLAIAGKRVTLVAATGFRPAVDFVVDRDEPNASPTVACRIDDGRLMVKGVVVRVMDRPPGSGPVAMFGIGTGRLVCEDAILRMPGEPRAPTSGEADHPDAFVIATGASGTSAGVALLRSRAAGDAVFLEVAPAATGDVSLEWSGGAFVSPRRLLVAGGAASGEVSVDCSLHDATFCCGEGIAALGDTLDRPDAPRLRVRAAGCRFVLTDADRPVILQAGAGEPDRYRAAITWLDEQSRYEGGAAFQRIDGAAERVDVGYREVLPPLFHKTEIGACPDPGGWAGW